MFPLKNGQYSDFPMFSPPWFGVRALFSLYTFSSSDECSQLSGYLLQTTKFLICCRSSCECIPRLNLLVFQATATVCQSSSGVYTSVPLARRLHSSVITVPLHNLLGLHVHIYSVQKRSWSDFWGVEVIWATLKRSGPGLFRLLVTFKQPEFTCITVCHNWALLLAQCENLGGWLGVIVSLNLWVMSISSGVWSMPTL